jgi:hypothetical protein
MAGLFHAPGDRMVGMMFDPIPLLLAFLAVVFVVTAIALLPLAIFLIVFMIVKAKKGRVSARTIVAFLVFQAAWAGLTIWTFQTMRHRAEQQRSAVRHSRPP